MNHANVIQVWPGGGTPEHYSGMNNLAKNLEFLMQGQELSPREIQRRCGVSQPTIHRILTKDDYKPRLEAIDTLAGLFGVTAHDLRFSDLTEPGALDVPGPRQVRDTVRIQGLKDFGPKSKQSDRLSPFEHLDVSMAWFTAQIGSDPANVRFAVMRDDSMRGEIEMGDVVFIDTTATSIEQAGDGIYAFTYFGISHIKYGQRPKLGELVFKGTKPFLDSIPIEGNEHDGLVIHGRIIAKLSLTKV